MVLAVAPWCWRLLFVSSVALLLSAAAFHRWRVQAVSKVVVGTPGYAGPLQLPEDAAIFRSWLATLPQPDAHNYSKVIVLPDVHGDLEQVQAALRLTQVLDRSGEWIGGNALVVQLGDVVDRGRDSLATLAYLERLQASAVQAGGRLVLLLGNHEVLNIRRDFRYVGRQELIDLAMDSTTETAEARLASQPGSAEQASALLATASANRSSSSTSDQQATANSSNSLETGTLAAHNGTLTPGQGHGTRQQILAGLRVWTQLTSSGTKYGSIIRGRDVAFLANVSGCPMLMVHAGVLPWMLEAVHQAAGRSPLAPQQYIQVWNSLAQRMLERCEHRYCGLANVSSMEGWLAGELLSGQGPVWTRFYAHAPEHQVCSAVDEVLRLLQAQRVVVGHTVQPGGRFTSRCGGRVVLMDVGMSRAMHGVLGALVCEEGRVTALYGGAKRARPHSELLRRG